MSEGIPIPKKSRSMAACLGCGLLQEMETWKNEETCPNCGWRGDFDRWVSSSYNGILALFQPTKSWCSSWLKYNKNQQGLYCIDNLGEVTPDIVNFLVENGKTLPEWVERYRLQNKNSGQ